MNNQTPISCIEIEPAAQAEKSIIWLHGLGADGNDFAPIVPELNLPKTLNVRFIFPNAPVMPVSINNGYKMPAWFDIYGVDLGSKIDATGIAKSVSTLGVLIAREIERGVATKNIVLGGFSQGAVIALIAGLTYPESLAGIIALSGFLPLAQETFANGSSANKHIPIFMAHGTEDPIVPINMGALSYEALKGAGYPASWHSYAMPHSVCGQEIHDITEFLLKVLG
jgi:phospholipase/carboxylesterase